MDKTSYRAGQCSILQNSAGTEVSDWHKSDTAGSGNVHDLPANENAPSVAAEQGVKGAVEGVCIAGDYIALFPILATHFGGLV